MSEFEFPTCDLPWRRSSRIMPQLAQQMIDGMKPTLIYRSKYYVRKTPELIQLAECCMACSGSVSLELALSQKADGRVVLDQPLCLLRAKIFRAA